MKGMVSVLCLALVACLGRAEPDCSTGQPEHQPHPTDCGLYYTCSNGVAILQECPDGLWWNVAVEACDRPESTVCSAGSSTTPAPTSSTSTPTPSTTPPSESPPPTEPIDTTPTSPTTTTSTTTIPPTTTTPSGGDNLCPAEDDPDVVIRYPHDTICEFYYRCTEGSPVLYSCHDGEQFSPTRKECTDKVEAGCDSCPPVEDPNEIIRLPHESKCHLYYLCAEGSPVLYQCRMLADQFSRRDRECMDPRYARCTLESRLY